jgi:DNA replication protein DnaC
MPLTNAQHDAIMRIYDGIQTKNQHIQNERYEEIVNLCPEIQEIENEVIALSLRTAAARIEGQSGNDYTVRLKELNERKTACLAGLSKPADYLEPIYDCKLCHDKGYVNGKKCSCFTKKAIDLVYSDSNMKNIISSENFDTFSYEWYDRTTKIPSLGLTPYNNMQRVVSICHSFIDNFDKKHDNLLFFGDTGIGKTFLSNCIARELLETSHSVIYLTATELFKRFEQKDFNKADTPALDSSYILDCDLLIIDDLGTEFGNSYTNSRLFYCINERILRQKSVIISTNLSLSDIRDLYSERVFSRLTSSYTMLKLVGDDIRILKKTRQKPV